MALAAFGPGIAILTRTDVSPSTPINAGYCQSLTISEKGTTKQLYGQNQYPLVVARSTIKSTGKLVTAEASGIAFNSTFYGQTFVSGGLLWNIGELPTVTSHSATVANSATFDTDLGVTYVASGLPLQKVSSITAAGQYTVSAGVYTFYTSDSNATTGNIAITYTSTITTGQSLVVANKPIGFTPTFQLDYYTSLNQPTAKPFIHRLYACIASGLDLDFKLEDFMMPSFEFEFFANAAGNVRDIVFPDVS